MNKCEFCNYYRPCAILFKCGWNFTIPYFKEDCCRKAQRKFEKYLKETNIRDGSSN